MDHFDAHEARANEFTEAGNIEEALKIYREGIGERERTLGPDHPETIKSYDILSTLYMNIGKYNEAFSVYNRLHSGYNFQLQLVIKLCQAGEYKKALRFTFKVQEIIMNDLCVKTSLILNIKSKIADVYGAMNNFKMALPYHKEVLLKYSHIYSLNHPKILSAMCIIASIDRGTFNFDTSLFILQRVHGLRQAALGPEHQDTINTYKGIGKIYKDIGNYYNALEVYKECYEIQLRVRPEHPDTLDTGSLIAVILRKQGKYDEALEILSEIFSIQEKKYSLHKYISNTINRIADVYMDKGELSQASQKYLDAHDMLECPPDHPVKLYTENKIATVYIKQKKYQLASKILQKLYIRCLVIFGPQHNETLYVAKNMAKLLYALGMYYDALNVFLEIQKVAESTDCLGPYHPETIRSLADIADTYLSLCKYDEALDIYNKISEIRVAILGSEHTECLSVQKHIASVYSQIGKCNEAFQILYKVFETVAKIFGADHIFTTETEHDIVLLSERLNTPNLIKSTIDEDLLAVKRCIQEGDDVNIRHYDGSVPLHIASEKGSTEIIEVLIKNGAIYNIKNMRGKKPENVAKGDAIKNIFNEIYSLFGCVKENNYEEASRIIRNKKFITNAKDRTGCTPLHWASKMGYVKTVEMLLNEGSDITMVTTEGCTPLHCPASQGNNEILEVILKYMKENNIDLKKVINAVTTDGGTTALHIAAKNGHCKTVILFLANGADSTIRDKLGNLPVDYAFEDEVNNLFPPPGVTI